MEYLKDNKTIIFFKLEKQMEVATTQQGNNCTNAETMETRYVAPFSRDGVTKSQFSKKSLLNLLQLNFSFAGYLLCYISLRHKLYCFNSEPMCEFMAKEMLLPTVYCNKFAPVERLNYVIGTASSSHLIISLDDILVVKHYDCRIKRQ